MKKTGIVSCYFIKNYGSAIQAYATQKALDELQIDNETINIGMFLTKLRKKQFTYILKSGFISDLFVDRLGKAKNLIYKKVITNNYTRNIASRDKTIASFIEKYIRFSEPYKSMDDLKSKCINNYNNILIGSDQLWLPANIAADYYTLNFVDDSINTVSYATSFGVSNLPSNIVNMASDFLKRIRHISVREDSGSNLVQTLTSRKVPVVCDPTILFSSDKWDEIVPDKKYLEEDYIFCYFIGESRLHRDFAKQLKKISGLKIIGIIHVDHFMNCDLDYADITPYDIGPLEFINLIKNAKYVCTDSFHCTVFSILYNKIFFDFKRYTNESKQSTNSRLDTLLNVAGLKERMLIGNENINDCLNMRIDYIAVNQRIETYRNKSLEYLRDAINNNKNTDL